MFRITSTYVENTARFAPTIEHYKDHLHIRGEYRFCRNKVIQDLGSPPHTWRIRIWIPGVLINFRITSTYVENTVIFGYELALLWDHLHIRGEYQAWKWQAKTTWGSPPHTWRIPRKGRKKTKAQRITSTYVENTLLKVADDKLLQDHLHIRGEYWSQQLEQTWRLGSPPHTWRIQ